MKNKILILAIILSTANMAWSQGEIGGRQIVNDGFILTSPTEINARVEGSPYTTKDYLPARISTFDNKIFSVKYDAVLDEILVKTDDGGTSEAYALPKNGRQDISITLLSGNKTYQIFDYVNEDSEKTSGFFVLLSSSAGPIKFLKKERIRFYEEKVPTSGYDAGSPAEYRRLNDSYFLKINDQPGIEFSTNKKKFARLFPKHEKEILNYIKEENINLKEESDLTKFALFLNQLN